MTQYDTVTVYDTVYDSKLPLQHDAILCSCPDVTAPHVFIALCVSCFDAYFRRLFRISDCTAHRI